MRSEYLTKHKEILAILKNISGYYSPEKFKKVIRLAVYSLLRHKLRSVLSILGIICGVIAVLAMLSIGEGAKQEAMKQIEQLGIRNIYIKSISLTEQQELRARQGLSRGVSLYDAERIMKGISSVEDTACVRDVTASVLGTNREVLNQIISCTGNYAKVLDLFVSQGRFISDEDIIRSNFVCVLGDGIASKLGSQGQTGSYIRIENHLFKVIGILKRQHVKAAKSSAISTRNFNEMILIPLGTERWLGRSPHAQSALQGPDNVNEIIVNVKRPDEVLDTVNAMKRVLEISHNNIADYQIVIPRELLEQAKRTQRMFNIVLSTIAFISLLVGGIGIMNIMLATVTERTKEIGIRRAVGATQEHIIVQFLSEAVVLTTAGGVIGVISGTVVVFLITSLSGWNTSITFLSLLLSLIMAVLVGIFFGIYPAYKASKLNPIEALRNE